MLLELPRNFGLFDIFYFVRNGNFFLLPRWNLVFSWGSPTTLSFNNILN